MKHHPDCGDPEAIAMFHHSVKDAEYERKMREAAEAKRLRWNPLGRWIIKTVCSKMPIRHPISGCANGGFITSTEYHLVDTWEKHSLFGKFTDVYGGKDTINNHVGST
jgi:hypothetical protein